MWKNEMERKVAAVTSSSGSSERKLLVHVGSIIIVSLLLMCALSIAGTDNVAAGKKDDYIYTVSGDGAIITGYRGDGGDIKIPWKLRGYPVVAIGYEAFYGCSALTSVTIPDSVTSIGKDAFAMCDALTAIEVEQGNPNYASIDGVLYDKDIRYLILYPSGKAGADFVIPDSVTTIGYSAFRYCAALNSVVIGNGVITIGPWAFSKCTRLESVTIGNSVTTIGFSAFRYCTALKSVIIPDSIITIGSFSFEYCTALKSVTIRGSGVTTIGYGAFSSCTALSSVTIGDGVTTIGDYAFWHCAALSSMTIPNSVTYIGELAFALCYALTAIEVEQDNPNYVSIDGVLYDMDIRYLIVYPSGKAGADFVIPDSVTTIWGGAFSGCTALVSVTVPDSVITIGYQAFSHSTSLESVTIGSGVTTIGDYAFFHSTALISMTVPDSIITIGAYAFSDCTALASVAIGSGVTDIGFRAFYSCTALTSIAFLGLAAPTTIGSDWIEGTAPGIQGHAYENSNFPAPGNYFHGLLMGVPIGFALNLVEGWNFVTVPTIGYSYKASTLGGIVDQVARWDPLTKQYTVWWSMPPDVNDSEVNDFAIEGNTGYWILPKAPGTLALVGTIPDAPQSRTINVPSGGGWAIVGFNSLNTTWTASDIVDMYTGGEVYQVGTWDSVAKAYTVWWSIFPEENDFSLVPGQGYWVYFTASGTLTYTP